MELFALSILQKQRVQKRAEKVEKEGLKTQHKSSDFSSSIGSSFNTSPLNRGEACHETNTQCVMVLCNQMSFWDVHFCRALSSCKIQWTSGCHSFTKGWFLESGVSVTHLGEGSFCCFDYDFVVAGGGVFFCCFVFLCFICVTSTCSNGGVQIRVWTVNITLLLPQGMQIG